jgi:hypothetical protein
MLIAKPTTLDILTVQPSYSSPHYASQISIIIDEAYLMFGPYIGDLPETSQLTALGYAVCHLFTLQCWADQGFPGTPSNMSSRNSSVRFAEGKHGIFSGSICGDKLYTLINQNKPIGLYVGPKKDCC